MGDALADIVAENWPVRGVTVRRGDTLTFCLPITPTAQQRPRHARFGGHDVTYKSASQQANERTLEACLLQHRPEKPLSGPLELSFSAIFPVPRSWTKKRREAALRGEMWHTARPDTDNLAKQLKDAMTRLGFWDDDRQVAAYGRCEKKYGERGAWRVSVRTLGSGEGL